MNSKSLPSLGKEEHVEDEVLPPASQERQQEKLAAAAKRKAEAKAKTWYWDAATLEIMSPSRRDGIDKYKELSYRQQAANLIQDMGQRLQVSQLCINTGIVYMHRFYVFHSMSKFPRNIVSAATLFLAAKIEEQPRKLEHVIKVYHSCLNQLSPNHGPLRTDEFGAIFSDLQYCEITLLQTIGFDVQIDHPHTHVVKCCHLVNASKDLAQTSYFMASNSLHLTTMCLQYKPTVVACFCIHLACLWSNWHIPNSNEGHEWFWYVDKEVTHELLMKLTEEFMHIFDRCPSKLKKKIKSVTHEISNAQANSQNSSESTDNSSPGLFDRRPTKREDLTKILLPPTGEPSNLPSSETSKTSNPPTNDSGKSSNSSNSTAKQKIEIPQYSSRSSNFDAKSRPLPGISENPKKKTDNVLDLIMNKSCQDNGRISGPPQTPVAKKEFSVVQAAEMRKKTYETLMLKNSHYNQYISSHQNSNLKPSAIIQGSMQTFGNKLNQTPLNKKISYPGNSSSLSRNNVKPSTLQEKSDVIKPLDSVTDEINNILQSSTNNASYSSEKKRSIFSPEPTSRSKEDEIEPQNKINDTKTHSQAFKRMIDSDVDKEMQMQAYAKRLGPNYSTSDKKIKLEPNDSTDESKNGYSTQESSVKSTADKSSLNNNTSLYKPNSPEEIKSLLASASTMPSTLRIKTEIKQEECSTIDLSVLNSSAIDKNTDNFNSNETLSEHNSHEKKKKKDKYKHKERDRSSDKPKKHKHKDRSSDKEKHKSSSSSSKSEHKNDSQSSRLSSASTAPSLKITIPKEKIGDLPSSGNALKIKIPKIKLSSANQTGEPPSPPNAGPIKLKIRTEHTPKETSSGSSNTSSKRRHGEVDAHLPKKFCADKVNGKSSSQNKNTSKTDAMYESLNVNMDSVANFEVPENSPMSRYGFGDHNQQIRYYYQK
ncbi:hypothetical protein TKK_0012159 [Trichogramma kaykai]|uniref:Cyclin-like domain-containing protein n=1 Tax=Trichogramma kaykai TaxID=54128 RepID=A0ABD2WMK7_9HYME